MTAPVESHGVTGTFVRPCQSCGRTVRVVDTVEQPHVCIPAETAGEGLARAWWAGHAQGQFDAARPDPVESTPDGGAVEMPAISPRGFKGFDPIDASPPAYHGSVRVYESSAASRPCIWLAVEGDGKVHLTVEDAARLRDQISYLIEHHYQIDRPVVSSPVQVDGETDAADLLYDAWVLIANARDWHGGGESAEWRQAAIRWRDRWHETLPGGDAPTCSRCDLTCAPTWVRTADGAAVCYDCATDDEWTTALGASS